MARKLVWVLVLMSIWNLVALLPNGHAQVGLPGRATASTGQEAYGAQNAIDGDMETRWGSAFTDHEWWQVAFDQPVSLAGLQIVWEEAYGEHYLIQVSNDGTHWQTVFEETAGDGKTDWIFFQPVTTRFLRLQGRQRGTGWGYSIWELRPLLASEWPTVQAGDTLPGSDPQAVVDGRPQTYWRSTQEKANHLLMTLPHPIELGGLAIDWGQAFATSYDVDLQTADGAWRRVKHISQGNGERDLVYFPAANVIGIQLRLAQSHSGQGYAIDEITLKGGDEQATPLRFYQALAQERPRGWYPRWLYREQEFWTTTGIPGDTEESLLGESGIFEPYKAGFTVMPFIHTRDRLLTWTDVKVEQALAEGYLPLPSVTWHTDSWTLNMAAVSAGGAGASYTAVRYRLTNHGTQAVNGRLILAVRPIQLNPKWQRGGFSPMRRVEAVPYGTGQALRINGQDKILAPLAPSQVAAIAFDQGTVLDCLHHTNCPTPAMAVDDEGKCEAALVYDIAAAPGAHTNIVLVFPLHGTTSKASTWTDAPSTFQAHVDEQRQYWQTLLQRVDIAIPEPKLVHMLQSNLAYILLNQDGPWIKPGPRNYSHSWIRDASMTGLALLRMGITEPVRQLLMAYIPLVDAKGWVPWLVFDGGKPVTFVADSREGHEYDSQGQFPFLVRNYVEFTGDTTLLDDAYAAVRRALSYGRALRRERMTEPYRRDPMLAAYYGILPESNSHEGYYPAQHSYWDDFWYLRGLKDGIYLAQKLGRSDDVAWMQAELQDARQDLYASMQRVIARDHLDYLPGSAEKGDFDATSTAIAIMVSDEAAHLPQPYATHTFARYYEHFVQRSESGSTESFTPYEVRTAEAFVRLGHRQQALAMLRRFTYTATHPTAWNHLAEVVHGRSRMPSYIGDMPHTWVGSGYISAVRSLFAYEEEDELVLAAGIDPAWIQAGMAVRHLPTRFGTLDYTIHSTTNSIRMHIEGKAAPPGGFTVRLPSEFRTRVVRLNGERVANVDASFQFAALPATLELQVQ